MSTRVLAKALFLCLIAVAGCASGQKIPAAAAQTAPSTNDYLIGPGDQLQIFVWDHTDLTMNVQVRPDGKISTPLVEDLQAAGESPTALARDIERVLAQYVRSPVVTVVVQALVGDAQQQI